VYWDNTNRRITTNALGNLAVGACVIAAASADANVTVDQMPSMAAVNPLRAAVLTLPVTAVASTPLTLTLPNCHILAFFQRTTTAYTGATVTLALGTTAGGVDIVAAADIKAKGSRTLTQVDASIDLATPFSGGTLYATIAQTTPTAVGAGQIIVQYLPIS
jgi:hypothetical protein